MMRIGEAYQIVFITSHNTLRLNRLSVLGILPGGEIRIHQKKLAYVVRTGETDVALDTEAARGIFVKRRSE